MPPLGEAFAGGPTSLAASNTATTRIGRHPHQRRRQISRRPPRAVADSLAHGLAGADRDPNHGELADQGNQQRDDCQHDPITGLWQLPRRARRVWQRR